MALRSARMTALPPPSSALLSLFNRLLDDAPWATRRLQEHAGATVGIDAAPLKLHFAIDAEGRVAPLDGDAPPELRIEIPLGELPSRLLDGGFERAAHAARIEGNAELADTLSFVLRNLDWDGEEALSHLVGDIAAHRLGGLFRAATEEGRRAVLRAGDNFNEYLVHDAALLPSRADHDAAQDALIRLRDDLARLEKRIQRIENRRGSRAVP